MQTKVLLRLQDIPGIETIEVYRSHGGYQALSKALTMSQGDFIQVVKDSGLRGRGGAGYPTSVKWEAVASQSRLPHYFICNAAEGEPGSFKDRELLKNPHQVLEATAISAYAMGAEKAFLYLRGLFAKEEAALQKAYDEACACRILGKPGIEIVIHRGEDSYIAGEETALIESLEGKPAIPRTKPPRPHQFGLWDAPTVVNNVETICNIITIVLHGSQEFRRYGTPGSPGTKLFCLSGQIQKPGLYEVPLGTRLSDLLRECGGGPLSGRTFTAVFPGGPSTPLIPYRLDPTLDFESLQAAGSSLGTGGIIVLDDSTDMKQIAIEVSSFFARESCGACPPCTIGTSETHRLFQSLVEHPKDAAVIVLKIKEFCEMMKFRGNCAHNRAAALNFLSLFKHFPETFCAETATTSVHS
jgi:NADH-quinone oxidoreductase subunit F